VEGNVSSHLTGGPDVKRKVKSLSVPAREKLTGTLKGSETRDETFIGSGKRRQKEKRLAWTTGAVTYSRGGRRRLWVGGGAKKVHIALSRHGIVGAVVLVWETSKRRKFTARLLFFPGVEASKARWV